MNFKPILTSLLSLAFLLGCGQPLTQAFVDNAQVQASSVKVEHTTVGDFRYHTINTGLLKSGQRDIVVYLPPSYKNNPSKKYPVLYMHDGQNIFDKATGAFGKEWYIDEKVEYLIQKKVIQEIIIVGVYNGLDQRLNELTWNPMPGEGGGNGKNYGDFLTGAVKPFVDKTYRTKPDRENTAVAGSSLGGLISFYIARNYSDTFSKIGIMSPSFWWNDGEALNEVDKMNGKFDFWLDGGTKEGSNPATMVNYVQSMSKKLSVKFGQQHVFEYLHNGAEHNEEAWATRIHGPIIEFFGTEKDPVKKMALIKRLMTLEEWSKL